MCSVGGLVEEGDFLYVEFVLVVILGFSGTEDFAVL